MTTSPPTSARPPGVASASVLAIVLGGWEALRALSALAGASMFAHMQEWIPHEIPLEDRAQMARIMELMTSTVSLPEILILAALTLPLAAWTIVAAIRLNAGKRGSVNVIVVMAGSSSPDGARRDGQRSTATGSSSPAGTLPPRPAGASLRTARSRR